VRQQRFTSVWARDAARRQTARKPAGLSREQIVRETIALLDAEGVDALSMRRLAARLGAAATSLYWYVANKDELLELAMDEVYAEVVEPLGPPGGEEPHWRDLASRFAYGLRNMILRHPWYAQQIGLRPSIGPNSLAAAERIILAFERAGFAGRDIDHAVGAVASYTLGSTLPEVAWRTGMARLNIPEREWSEQLRGEVERSAERFPALLEKFREWMAQEDISVTRQVAFDFGLVSLLDGLEARLRR